MSYFQYLNQTTPYPLDLYPSTMGAYSLRKLRRGYTGNCVRVRRSSDNAESDIGFTGDAINTTALLAWVGGGNGFVVIWYDQSGNSNDATQSTGASQPLIVGGGSLQLLSGQPTIRFNNAKGFPLVMTNNQVMSVFTVVMNLKATPSFCMFQAGTNQYGVVADGTTATTTWGAMTALPQVNSINKVVTSMTTRLAIRNTFAINTKVAFSALGFQPNVSWGSMNIFNYPDATYNWDGYCSEIVFYYGDKTADRVGIEDSLYTYYGV